MIKCPATIDRSIGLFNIVHILYFDVIRSTSETQMNEIDVKLQYHFISSDNDYLIRAFLSFAL